MHGPRNRQLWCCAASACRQGCPWTTDLTCTGNHAGIRQHCGNHNPCQIPAATSCKSAHSSSSRGQKQHRVPHTSTINAGVQKSPPLRKGRNAPAGGARRDHDHIPAHHDPGMVVSFNQVRPPKAVQAQSRVPQSIDASAFNHATPSGPDLGHAGGWLSDRVHAELRVWRWLVV